MHRSAVINKVNVLVFAENATQSRLHSGRQWALKRPDLTIVLQRMGVIVESIV